MLQSSTLTSLQVSTTPTALAALVRELCEYVRERTWGKLGAHIRPSQNKLTLAISGAFESVTTLIIVLGPTKTYLGPLGEMQLSMRFPNVHVQMPDMAEALHTIGMLLAALTPVSVTLAARDSETNAEIWERLQGDPDDPAPMATCDRIPGLFDPRPSSTMRGECVLTESRTFTPTEVYSWACAAVTNLIESLGSNVRARIYGVRIDGASGVDLAGQRSQSHSVVLELAGDGSAKAQIIFLESQVKGFSETVALVPDLQHALHIAGMLIEGLNASVTSVGVSAIETNEEVLARPLSPGKKRGVRTVQKFMDTWDNHALALNNVSSSWRYASYRWLNFRS